MNRWDLSLDCFISTSKVISSYKDYIMSAEDCHVLERFDKFVFLCYFFLVFSPSVKGGYLCSSSQFILSSL